MSRNLAFLLILVLAGCRRDQPPARQTAAPADSIVLERTLCFGTCPAYRVSIASTGAVHFRSRNPGDTTRTASGSISTVEFDRLVRQAAEIGFWQLPDQIQGSRWCTREATDNPSVIVTIFAASGRKRVDDYHGCMDGPARLRQFQAQIDSVAGSERWVRPARLRRAAAP